MGTKRRMSNSSSYIGAGNNLSVFNRKPKTPFKKIKKLYDIESEKIIKRKKWTKRTLTEQEKNEIREQIKKRLVAERKKNWIIGIITFIIILTILSMMNW